MRHLNNDKKHKRANDIYIRNIVFKEILDSYT